MRMILASLALALGLSAAATARPVKKVRITTSSSVGTVAAVVLAAYPQRDGLVIYNTSTDTVAVTLTDSGTCTTTAPTHVIAANSSWEMWGPSVWAGPVCAIRAAGSGALTSSEFW